MEGNFKNIGEKLCVPKSKMKILKWFIYFIILNALFLSKCHVYFKEELIRFSEVYVFMGGGINNLRLCIKYDWLFKTCHLPFTVMCPFTVVPFAFMKSFMDMLKKRKTKAVRK